MYFLLDPLLIPAPLNFRPKDKVDFDMLWAGTYCTFAREATKGSIYVWGLNNYQQIGNLNKKLFICVYMVSAEFVFE